MYIITAALAVAAGCSKDEAPADEASSAPKVAPAGGAAPAPEAAPAPKAAPAPEAPKSFAEARKKGMVDVRYNAQLKAVREEANKEAAKANEALNALRLKYAKARASGASADQLAAIEKELRDGEAAAKKAEIVRRRKAMAFVKMQMMKEDESVARDLKRLEESKDAAKRGQNAQ